MERVAEAEMLLMPPPRDDRIKAEAGQLIDAWLRKIVREEVRNALRESLTK